MGLVYVLRKFHELLACVCGEFIKLFIRLNLIPICNGINQKEYRKEKIIVSLTSYGRRVSKVAPFAIVSLLRQTYKPDKIILWLDSEHWNDNNLPRCLLKLKRYGLMIRYCKDIKSYKKLIPSLSYYPNDIIITCDDDLYYKKNMLERLVKEYYKNPNRIYTHRAHKPILNDNGLLKSYRDWDHEVNTFGDISIFPTGGAGCLYKKSLLYKDVCCEELFMSLSPKADDVWFYFMEVLQSTPRVVLYNRNNIYYPLDFFYQYFHKGESLFSDNCLDNQNDIQIQAVMKYYNLKPLDLMKI